MHLLRDPLPAPRRRAPLTRVIGLGSPFGGDRAGWEVVEQLHPRVDPAVDCVAIDRPGAGLVTWLAGIDRLILVDALLGAADGGFSVLSADQLAAAGARIDSHRLDLGQALALAGVLGQPPGEVTVYAIHIVAEDLERARPELQGTIAAVVADIAGRLRTAPSAR